MHTNLWVAENATSDLLQLFGDAVLYGASEYEQDYIMSCIRTYVETEGEECSGALEYLLSKYDSDRKPQVAILYALMILKRAPEKELVPVNDYFYGFKNRDLGRNPENFIKKMKEKYMI